MQSWFNRKRKE